MKPWGHRSYFHERHGRIEHAWRGKIFLNPPFDAWPAWLAKLEKEITTGRVKEAIVIGPANVCAFRPLAVAGWPLLLVPTERPKFLDPTADRLIVPPFGSLLCYVGDEKDRFVEVFGAAGFDFATGLILR